MNLPELADDWRWNKIKEASIGSAASFGKEFVVSASRFSGLPNYYSHTFYVSLKLDDPESIKALFNTAFEAVAAATQLKRHENQANWDAIDEMLTGFENERLGDLYWTGPID